MHKCILLVFLTFTLGASAQSGTLPDDSLRLDSTAFYQTFDYHQGLEDTLSMDFYAHDDTVSRPLLVFVHGGGFYTGTNRNASVIAYCDSLRNWGYAVASVEYTLHLKGQSFHCDQPVYNKVRAVEACVWDVRQATAYLLERAEALKIDSNHVILIGSSAGAEAALHAAYWDWPARSGDSAPLDSTFQYAGVVGFAGALEDTALITTSNLIPTALFHGTCDPLVPFASDIHHYCPKRSPGAWMLHGSWSIAQKIEELGGSYYLHAACGEGHRMAGRPMIERIGETILFLQSAVEQGNFMQVTVVEPGPSDCDYIDFPPCKQ